MTTLRTITCKDTFRNPNDSALTADGTSVEIVGTPNNSFRKENNINANCQSESYESHLHAKPKFILCI